MITTKAKPILFKGPMVLALLAGTKTQTRRIIFKDGQDEHHMPWWCAGTHWQDGDDLLNCPYEVGDLLWVRETWQDYCPLWDGGWCGHGDEEGIKRDHQPVYRADSESSWLRGPEGKQRAPERWKPSFFMPRWASRLTLEVTEVRAERLQAHAYNPNTFGNYFAEGYPYSCGSEIEVTDWFSDLWESINGKGSWAANPWVWVYGVKRVTEGTAP